MDTIDGMRTLVSVVSEGSFSGAAERLNMSPQLVSKYVGQLEERLGTRLLNRTTRRLSITEAGQAYVERCKYVLAEIDEMESAVGDAAAAARGTLRINAPMTFGTMHLSKAIADYQCEQPEVSVDLTLDEVHANGEPVAIDEPDFVYSDSRFGTGYEDVRVPAVQFRIQEDRIFKNGDLRYFDHPRFGVLAKITRVEEAEEEEDLMEPEMLGDGPAGLIGGVDQ